MEQKGGVGLIITLNRLKDMKKKEYRNVRLLKIEKKILEEYNTNNKMKQMKFMTYSRQQQIKRPKILLKWN